ncbi:hypothetical protein HPP92_000324 [Vanilla planifolia]|uniref:Alliinase C-terminal domain-containing protein n=1 Tax=Vanilla planifolia TaxID=51239 RepID=A0A835SAZ9_VANPL|nr:hypothetical protein HPP92_000324 [Vanilla planifolia]
MASSSGSNEQTRTLNLTAVFVLAGAVLVFHLFASSVLLPFYKASFCGGYPNGSPILASSSATYEQTLQTTPATAVEDEIYVSPSSGSLPASQDSVINLDHGDPTMYEKFWRETGSAADLLVLPGSRTVSYFSDVTNLCWFLEPDLASEIRRLHLVVGNAVVADDSFIIVGTGSSQLFQAALFALSTSPEVVAASAGPVPVISSVPYYSSYPAAADLLRSRLFRWAGDTSSFKQSNKPYIEVVCSPSNPDGSMKATSVGSSNGKVIHDLAYYWPQYTAITGPANHDIMLFTVSKCTGHAGMRLGWALVRHRDVAKRMVKFMEVSTIGVSRDSQLRAGKILKAVSDGYKLNSTEVSTAKLFHFSRNKMVDRWGRLRDAVASTGAFSLPQFQPEYCNFMKEVTFPSPECNCYVSHGFVLFYQNDERFAPVRQTQYEFQAARPQDEWTRSAANGLSSPVCSFSFPFVTKSCWWSRLRCFRSFLMAGLEELKKKKTKPLFDAEAGPSVYTSMDPCDSCVDMMFPNESLPQDIELLVYVINLQPLYMIKIAYIRRSDGGLNRRKGNSYLMRYGHYVRQLAFKG